jgi:hypothetical protein
VRAGDRATGFRQRCDGLGIRGVSLQSYRYAWAYSSLASTHAPRFDRIGVSPALSGFVLT